MRLGEDRHAPFKKLIQLRRAGAWQAKEIAGQDLIDSPALEYGNRIIDGDVIAFSPQKDKICFRRRLHDERTVRRGDELSIGKSLRQIVDQLSLPQRMQVQIDFINEDNRWLGEWVGAVRITLDHSAGEIDHPGDDGLIAVTQVPKRNPAVGRVKLDARNGVHARSGKELNAIDLRQDSEQKLLDLLQPLLLSFP